jgi:hypothetical protein|uniref:Uncharacterized protein n=1 Tax=viral metagenome TaxID=1070528 RepID=A0A6C0AKQ4_9ZZZZ
MTITEEKAQQDLNFIIKYINNHENKQGIISMFMKGPPKGKGHMWCCTQEGGPEYYWNYEEADGLKEIRNLVLNKGWGYYCIGFMMRKIQTEIKKNVFRKSPPLYDENKDVENPEEIVMEYEDEPQTDIDSKFYKERFAIHVAQNYLNKNNR